MRKLFIALLAVICLASCSNNNLKIKINLQNANDKTVYLQRYIDEDMVTIDSAIVKKDKAVFKVNKDYNSDAYFINIEKWKRPLTFFTVNQDVMIVGDYQNFNQINIQAGERQDKLIALERLVDSIENEAELKNETIKFIEENNTDAISAYVLYRYKWMFNINDLRSFIDCVKFTKSCYVSKIKHYIEDSERVSVGRNYINFKQETINNDTFVLAEFIKMNKLTMIDFWASWCPDCRKENPNVVAVYNAYNKNGFDIVSVSLDTDKEAWKKAVIDDNLTWRNHTSDLKGWNNSVAGLYCVAFIPQNVIINKDGVIVARNLAGDDLMNFVKDYLK